VLSKLSGQMARLVAEATPLGAFSVFDAEGNWLVNSHGLYPPGASNADRAYFAHHRATASREPFIGEPVRSRSRGHWIVTISRRFNRPDGGFGGVVAGTIDLDRFTGHATSFDIGARGSVALFRGDGLQLMRVPEDAIGHPFRDAAGAPAPLPQIPKSNSHYVSPVDGVDRIGSILRGNRYPLAALAALSYEEAMAAWTRETIRSLLGAALVTLAMAGVGLRLLQQMRRRQEAEAALSDREASFRLLAENSSDMVSRIGPDGVFRYVSPAARRIMGQEPEALLHCSALDSVHPADLPTVKAMAARLASELQEAKITYRVRRPDGTEVWVEAALRVAHDPRTGQPDGVVAVSRDVTERQVLEARLSALATIDPLTGLHNRRALDDALEREWRRASRERLPLSLLLLDVDHFKALNDSFGHTAGDTCLREIAAAVGDAIRRPSDLAARFGGEEFAFLLPGTEAAGAVEVGERIRIAVQALGLAHTPSVGGVVTVSVGAASCIPAAGSPVDSAGALVAAADAALYAAKRAGRNRVSLAAEVAA
jgi:diguanylate cyclase (GGDEF)-like protein/PAS domain S-box-containing protein